MRERWQRVWVIGAALLVVALAGALRIWGLPRPPAGPYYDEAANGILAASIADKGYRPIFVTAYTGKEVLFFYLTALVMKLIGTGLLALRLTSAIVGTLTVGATLWCVRELFPDGGQEADTRRGVVLSLLTAGLLATSFWHLVLSRVGLRAVAQPLLQALAVALLWRGLRTSDYRALIAGGVCCGLAGYTYLAARLFPVPLGLALSTLVVADRARWQARLAQVGAFGAAAVTTFAPLGLYFLRNPERFSVRIEQVASQPGIQSAVPLPLPQAFAQALGMFVVAGDPLPRLNLPGKPVFGPVLGAVFLLGLALTVHDFLSRREPLARARGVLLLTWIPVMILPTALAVADFIPHHLRAAGLLPLIYLFPALAITRLIQRTSRWTWAPWIVVVVLAWATLATARDYFIHLAGRADHYEISDGDLADMAEWLNASEWTDTTVYIASIHYRHPTLAFLADDYAALKWLTGGRTLVAPAQGSALVAVPRSVDYRWAEEYVPRTANMETPVGPDEGPAFGAFRLEANSPLAVSHQEQVDFGHIIQLEGYDLLSTPGLDGAVDVALLWRVLNSPPREDYQVFAHLLDAWGSHWGEGLPFQYPSSQWTPGERFLDRIRVALPPGTPPGEYTLNVGLYSAASDSNLTVVREDGGFAGLVARLPITLSARQGSAPDEVIGIRRPLNLKLAPGLQLLGVNLDTTSARTREQLILTLFWRADALLDDLTIRLRLGDLTLYQGAPVHGTYPTPAWRPGAVVADRYSPRVPLDAPAGEWQLEVELVTPSGRSRSVELGTVSILAPERSTTVPKMQHAVGAALGDYVELLGYDVDGLDDPAVKLTLYWRAVREMEMDYTVYAHLIAADGTLAGQMDGMPQAGTYPTSLWATREVIADHYEISVAEGAAHPLSLRVGMYQPATGEQLGGAVVLQ